MEIWVKLAKIWAEPGYLTKDIQKVAEISKKVIVKYPVYETLEQGEKSSIAFVTLRAQLERASQVDFLPSHPAWQLPGRGDLFPLGRSQR